MHALVVTYTSTAPPDALRAAQHAFAEHLVAVPGFVSKTWLDEGPHQGGFYLFTDRRSAQDYLAGPLFASLRESQAVTDLEVRGYGVATDLGARTGVPA
jgi:hypothetical protein